MSEQVIVSFSFTKIIGNVWVFDARASFEKFHQHQSPPSQAVSQSYLSVHQPH